MSVSSAFDLENDDGLRRLLYWCAFLLFFMPYFQSLAGLWPLQLFNLQWRFRAAGSMSGIMMLPFLGLGLGLAIARSNGQKGITRLIGIIAGITALGLVVAVSLFMLDALQLKKIIRDVQMADFNKAVATATMTMLISLVSFSWMALVSFRSPRGTIKAAPKSTRKSSVDEPVGLLIGQNYTKE